MRVFYLNGDYVPEDQANISVMDRGFLMADAVYEVVSVLDGKLLDFEGHFERLGRSTEGLNLPMPFTRDSLLTALREMVARNALVEGGVYLQVSRGAAERDFLMPKTVSPTVVMFTQERILEKSVAADKGIAVVTRPDLRWGRGDIKTTQLLYASLMKSEAVAIGADDCWMEREGMITEGTSNNAYIVKDKTIITHAVTNDILAGITRATLLELCVREGYQLEERSFSIDEAEQADEAFVTSAGALVLPVVKINDHSLSNGAPGQVTTALRKLYIDNARARAV